MLDEFKAPLWLKIILAIFIIMLILYNSIYDSYKFDKNIEKFYKKSFSSKIVSVNNFPGRRHDFLLENGLKIHTSPTENKLMIGDSIEKKKETYKYNVFRENIFNEYQYVNTYEIMK